MRAQGGNRVRRPIRRDFLIAIPHRLPPGADQAASRRAIPSSPRSSRHPATSSSITRACVPCRPMRAGTCGNADHGLSYCSPGSNTRRDRMLVNCATPPPEAASPTFSMDAATMRKIELCELFRETTKDLGPAVRLSARTRCASWRASPTPRTPTPNGAGRDSVPMRSSRCSGS